MRTLVVAIVAITMILHTDAANKKEIEATCKNTPNPKLCTSVLEADPISSMSNVSRLSLGVVSAIGNKTNESLAIIDNLRKSQPMLSFALNHCTAAYKAVLEADIPVADLTVPANNKLAEDAVANAGALTQICEHSIQLVGASPPLTQLNNYVGELVAIALAMIRNLS